MLVVRGGLNRPKYPILSLHHDHLTSSYGSYRHPLRTSVVTFIQSQLRRPLLLSIGTSLRVETNIPMKMQPQPLSLAGHVLPFRL
jgi:hypothetical protein